jgi:energy-coupling factor transport system ATP-binding protein
MLSFHRVSFSYDGTTNAQNDVTFTLPPSTCSILAGRNGSGKSTIVQLSNGLLRPQDGELRLRGASTSLIPVHELVRDVAVMFQHPGDQLTERTVERDVAVGVHALHLDHPQKRVQAALELVDLSSRAKDHPYDLEPAERKLVALASVIALRSPLVVLDEPLVGLGPAQTHAVENVLHHLRNEGRTILLVVHDVVQAWAFADRVVVLDRGTVTLESDVRGTMNPTQALHAAGMKPPASERIMQALSHVR